MEEIKLSQISYKNALDRRAIKDLYLTSFPKEELLPFWEMRFLTAVRGIEMNGYYEDGHLCAFTYTVTEGNILFVLFFAVCRELRGQGYGSAVLDFLKKNNPHKDILLNVEPLDESAENYSERVRRMDFYTKNGFFDTGYDIAEVGGIFRVLSTCPTLDTKEYLRIFKRMSFGLWHPDIKRVN